MKNFKNDVHVAFSLYVMKGHRSIEKPGIKHSARLLLLGKLFEKISEQLEENEFLLDAIALTNNGNSAVYTSEEGTPSYLLTTLGKQFYDLFSDSRSNRILFFTKKQMLLVFPSVYFETGHLTSFKYEEIPDIVLRKKEIKQLNELETVFFLDFQAQDKIFSDTLTLAEAKHFEIIHSSIKQLAQVPLLDKPKRTKQKISEEHYTVRSSARSINWVVYALLLLLALGFLLGIVPFFIK